MSEINVRRLRQCALPDPHDEREVWCAKELTWAAERIEELEQRLKDTEFLYHGYFVLATEAGVRPGSRELTDAAARFNEALEASLGEKAKT